MAKWLQKAGDSQDKHSDLSSVSSLGLGKLVSHASIASIYIPYSAKFSRNLYFVEWPLKAFRCTMFAE